MTDNREIKIINGDCLDILPTIKEDFIIVTDPPFNIGYHYNEYKDKLSQENYYEMLGEVFSYSPFVVIHYPEEIYKIAFQTGYFPEKVISWVYNSNTAKQHRDIAFFGIKPDFTKVGQPYKNPTDKRVKKLIEQGKQARLYDWWNINQVKNVSKDKTNHPCQMPLEVMEKIIGLLPKNITIVDPFMGSGTTGLACKKLNRKFIGIEIDETYFNICKDRLSL
jgi:site-specific DNA-methyltransferase (adenine-specific)